MFFYEHKGNAGNRSTIQLQLSGRIGWIDREILEHLLSCRARKGPTVHGDLCGRPFTKQRLNYKKAVCLENTICSGTINMTSLLLNVAAHIAFCFETYIFRVLLFPKCQPQIRAMGLPRALRERRVLAWVHVPKLHCDNSEYFQSTCSQHLFFDVHVHMRINVYGVLGHFQAGMYNVRLARQAQFALFCAARNIEDCMALGNWSVT